MSLLNTVSNKEVFDFLETLTIKSTYFADKIRKAQIRTLVEPNVPETSNPYTLHLAGEYVLDDRNNRGYQLTNDTTVNNLKNYWRLIGNDYFRVSAQDLQDKYPNPHGAGLYEIKPFVVKGVIDPITGESEDQSYRVSQNVYDREGYLSLEYRNSEIFIDDIYDEMMYVTSLDTKQEIPFTLENLYQDCANEAVIEGRRTTNGVHTKTLEAYKVPGRYFDLLCQRYPTQVDLIKAIVYRVPTREISSLATVPELRQILVQNGYATAEYVADLAARFTNNEELLKKLGADIEGARDSSGMTLSELRRTRIAKAKNFDLLGYDYSRLDENERLSILEHTQKFLKIIANRWAINEYTFEENYAAVLWSAMWSMLPLALISKRYANIKTPSVSLENMWDYLKSKGLSNYNGYLTSKQTLFLYKNINYLLQHAAQQKALNILIDNILSDYGLTIKSKTVVLDTSDSLKLATKPTIAKDQCSSCSRNGVSCFKNITNYLCDEWLGTKTLCKAEPIVLNEEFAGSTKQKVIKLLQSEYGYTEEAAEFKYQRAFIWRDEDIEAIKDDLDRDQMVDTNATTETLDTTIKNEHASGNEPVYNDDVVEEQRKMLQHMNGVYAPTKLLEMCETEYNSKFAALFNRFFTETMLKLAPRVNDDGTITNKVDVNYSFTVTENAYEYLLDFGEALAAGYLGFTREFLVDGFIDKLSKDSEGKPLYEYALDDSGNKIQIDTDKDGNPIYLKKLSSWVQEAFTNFTSTLTYKFPIPDKCRTTTALKFGKPVLQEELITTWKSSEDSGNEDLLDLVTNGDENTRILTIRDINYAVTKLDSPDTCCLTSDTTAQSGKLYYTLSDGKYILANVSEGDPLESGIYYEENSIWEGFTLRLKILGNFTKRLVGKEYKYIYHENDDEIPLIPKYFKWYSRHLNPSIDATEEEKAEMKKAIRLIKKPIYTSGVVTGYETVEVNAYTDDDIDAAFVDLASKNKDPQHQTGVEYIDTSKKTAYDLFRIDQFIDISNIIDRWIDISGTISDASEITGYIDTMFEIIEELYCYASGSISVRTHLACSTILDEVISKKTIHFDLTGTDKTHDTSEGGLCAYFSDWLSDQKELLASFTFFDNLDDAVTGWNEFNSTLMNALLDGCTIPYAKNITNKTLYQKLKELVVQLSSYRITFIDNEDVTKVSECSAAVVEDAMLQNITEIDNIFFDPVGDSECPPHVGGYPVEVDNCTGDMLLPTSDLRRVEGKEYLTLSVADSTVYDNPDEKQKLHPMSRPLGKIDEAITEGDVIEVGSEAINLPTYTTWKPYRETTNAYMIKDVNYYLYVETSKGYKLATTDDFESVLKSEVSDLPDNVLVGTDSEGNEVVYKIDVAFELIAVGDKLPTGKCWEKVNLYTILGIDAGTPLLISKKNNRWYYRTGMVLDGDNISYPANASVDEHGRTITTTGDSFDLENEFSNATTKLYFDSVVYRVAVPTTVVAWTEPTESSVLEQYLYRNINHEFILTENTEPAILIQESEYPTKE